MARRRTGPRSQLQTRYGNRRSFHRQSSQCRLIPLVYNPIGGARFYRSTASDPRRKPCRVYGQHPADAQFDDSESRSPSYAGRATPSYGLATLYLWFNQTGSVSATFSSTLRLKHCHNAGKLSALKSEALSHPAAERVPRAAESKPRGAHRSTLFAPVPFEGLMISAAF
jgi:hypothetical protein